MTDAEKWGGERRQIAIPDIKKCGGVFFMHL